MANTNASPTAAAGLKVAIYAIGASHDGIL